MHVFTICTGLTAVLLYRVGAAVVESEDAVIKKLQKKYKNIVNVVDNLNKTISILEQDAGHSDKFHHGFQRILEAQFHEESRMKTANTRTQLRVTTIRTSRDNTILGIDYRSRGKADIYLREFDGVLHNKEFQNVVNDGGGTLISTSNANTWYIDMNDYNSYLNLQMDGTFSDYHTEALAKFEVLTFIETNVNLVEYHPGESSELKIRFNKHCKLSYIMLMTRSRTRAFEVDMMSTDVPAHTGIVKLTSRGEFNDYIEYTLSINADKNDYVGVIDVAVEPNRLNGSDLYFFSLGTYIPVVMEGQKHPYPKDFMGFYGLWRQYTCQIGQQYCAIRGCMVANDPAKLTVWKILQGGDRMELASLMTQQKYMVCTRALVHDVSIVDGGEYVVVATNSMGRMLERPLFLNVTTYAPPNGGFPREMFVPTVV